MKVINDDIFNGDWSGMVHCANLYHTFGAGIAREIKKRYPDAYDADLKSPHGDISKLGDFSHSKIEHKDIFNLYGQTGIGNDNQPLNRNCQYDAVHDGLWKIGEHILEYKEDRPYILAIPYGMGCGLAGGEWSIVYSILAFIENNFADVHFDIYKI